MVNLMAESDTAMLGEMKSFYVEGSLVGYKMVIIEPFEEFLYIKFIRNSPPIHWSYSPDLKLKGLIGIWCRRRLPNIIFCFKSTLWIPP